MTTEAKRKPITCMECGETLTTWAKHDYIDCVLYASTAGVKSFPEEYIWALIAEVRRLRASAEEPPA